MLNEFILLATAHIFAVASPGADFAAVIKNTLQSGRQSGLYTAVGVGLGIFVHVAYTLLGVAVLLSQSPQWFHTIKIIGALYLIWLAIKSFQSRKRQAKICQHATKTSMSNLGSLRQGFIVNVLNPKVTLFFVALFTSIVSIQTPLLMQTVYGFWLSIYTMLWFMLVAWWFSRKFVLRWYHEHGHYVDWLMGVFLMIIAARLLMTD